MRSCKSLITANKVLEELVSIEELKDCWYHSCHSGGLDPNGLCGYILHGKCKGSTIKVVFYGASKFIDTPVHIYVLINEKNKVRDKQLSVEDAIKFIVNKLTKFIER